MPLETAAATGRPAWSLRRRLLLLIAIATLVAWLAGGAATYFISHRQSDALSDQRMQSVAQTLLTLTDHEIDEMRLEGRGLIHVDEDQDPALAHRYRYQVWSPSPQQLLLTNGDPKAGPIAPFEQVGFVTRPFEGAPARTIVAWSEDRTKVLQIAEPLELREPFAHTAFASLFGLFLVSLAALLIIDAWMIRRATGALQESARQLTQRSPNDLRPIEVSSPPIEVQPLVREINALFRRFASALETERRFTSAAAHELRTPLAAVKVHAQVAQLTRTAPERKQALELLIVAIDRASHMVDQLLTLSRLDGMLALRSGTAPLRLDVIAGHVIDEVRPLLGRRGQRIEADLSPCEINGMEFGVASLLRNLIDNAMRYGPAGREIRVTVGARDGHRLAIVEDAGPGIPAEERERVFERFYRLYSDTDGCGIGLSIVRTVAEVHQARIDLDKSDLGGLRVSVTFPGVPVPPTHPSA
ncbi:MAG TPA: ATP-binding protein [Burkholderiaceae bacterium]|jgi:two-component system sensor histidine kinase QseC|nr:ATP-binding protein [Burkholderiaceae bacterium]